MPYWAAHALGPTNLNRGACHFDALQVLEAEGALPSFLEGLDDVVSGATSQPGEYGMPSRRIRHSKAPAKPVNMPFFVGESDKY